MKYIKYLLLLSLSSCLILSSTEIKPPEDHLLQPLFAKPIEPTIDEAPWQIKLPTAEVGSQNAKIPNVEQNLSLGLSKKPIISAIAVEQDLVFLNNNGVLSRVTNVGDSVWSKNVINSKKHGHLLLVNDVIIVVTGTTKLYAIDAKNGDIIWQKDLRSPIHSPAIKTDSSHFLAMTIDNYFYAIESTAGQVTWSSYNSPPALQRINNQRPTYYNDKIILPPNENELVAISAENGSKLWEAELDGNYQSSFFYGGYNTPVILGDVVLSSNYVGKTEAFDIESGKKKWEQYISIKNKPFVFKKVMFAITEDKHLIALTSDGKLKWRVPMDRANYGPVLFNDLLWVFNDQGKAYGYKLQTGEQVDKIDIPSGLSYPPFILDSLIYSFDKNGDLLVIGKK